MNYSRVCGDNANDVHGGLCITCWSPGGSSSFPIGKTKQESTKTLQPSVGRIKIKYNTKKKESSVSSNSRHIAGTSAKSLVGTNGAHLLNTFGFFLCRRRND